LKQFFTKCFIFYCEQVGGAVLIFNVLGAPLARLHSYKYTINLKKKRSINLSMRFPNTPHADRHYITRIYSQGVESKVHSLFCYTHTSLFSSPALAFLRVLLYCCWPRRCISCLQLFLCSASVNAPRI
jgi:hypothetical protein